MGKNANDAIVRAAKTPAIALTKVFLTTFRLALKSPERKADIAEKKLAWHLAKQNLWREVKGNKTAFYAILRRIMQDESMMHWNVYYSPA